MSEKSLQQEIRLALGSRPDIRVFRNNNGVLIDKAGNRIRYGLFPGSSDMIGWRSLKILPEHVGKTVAVFMGAEIKSPKGDVRDNQIQWRDTVRQFGGIAEILRSTEDARLITEWEPKV